MLILITKKLTKRYSLWVENSFSDGEEIYVVEYEGEIAGFLY